ncbi:MAG: PASTA domain-containing protein [Bryobacteraceae bacterium]|jgi:hypothetical protein
MTGAYGKLLTSILIGAAGSLVAAAVMLGLGQRFAKEKVRWKNVILTVVVAAGLSIAAAFMGFDIHYAVPNLDYLPLAEAEDRLAAQHLDSVAAPVENPGIEPGRVVPKSQSLSPGLLVQSGTTLSFSVSDEGTNSLDYPHTNGQVDCVRKQEGFCTISVEGRDSALVSSGQLRSLLWTKSRESGWYLQDQGSTQTELIRPDRTWRRQAQVGNSRYAPSDGELVDLALTVVSSSRERDVGKQRGQSFREPEGWPISTAERVAIRLVGGQ